MTCPICGVALELVSAAGGGDVGALLARIDEANLDDKAREFVQQTRDRFARYRDRIKISPKQLNWLERIADKQGGKTEERRPPDSWSPRPDSDIPF